MKRILVVIILFTLFSTVLKGQNNTNEDNLDFSNHSVNLEIFGKGFWFGNISYEYTIKQKFVLGAGIGFMGYLSGKSNRMHDGSSETGDYTDLNLTFPLYAMYKMWAKKKHHLLITVGATPTILSSSHDYPSEKFTNYEFYLPPVAGIGYEFKPGMFFYRVNIYAQYLGKNAWYPTVAPWAGIGFGRSF